MTNRVHIDAPAGVIDIEGEKDFVEGLLAKVFPLIEEIGFGSHPPGKSSGQDAQDDSSTAAGTGTTVEDAEKSKIKRRRGATPPKGQSCGDRLLTLKADGFFKKHRVGADIVAGLKAKGWTHKSNQVAAAAGNLFGRGELQRTKDGSGPFNYFWDRD
jgi:hypothetical protein